MTFIYLLIVFAVHMIIDLVLRKKLKIKIQKGFFRSFKGKNKFFVIAEITIIISFFISIFFVIPSDFRSFSLFIFFFIIWALRGLEEWIFKRQEKEYYHSWVGASLFLFSSIIIFLGEF